ncbi:hypothetical protein AB6A40_005699 [Gnathostoma spinigerum]|uniref:Uncharacterized protein n=1 Tax=Gnathostoma spinigerum TaxID=75299 RepID=A0ABD6ERV2_9BILA
MFKRRKSNTAFFPEDYESDSDFVLDNAERRSEEDDAECTSGGDYPTSSTEAEKCSSRPGQHFVGSSHSYTSEELRSLLRDYISFHFLMATDSTVEKRLRLVKGKLFVSSCKAGHFPEKERRLC